MMETGASGWAGRRAPGDDALAIGRVEYLLAEIDTWADLLPPGLLTQLRLRYTERLGRLRTEKYIARDDADAGQLP